MHQVAPIGLSPSRRGRTAVPGLGTQAWRRVGGGKNARDTAVVPGRRSWGGLPRRSLGAPGRRCLAEVCVGATWRRGPAPAPAQHPSSPPARLSSLCAAAAFAAEKPGPVPIRRSWERTCAPRGPIRANGPPSDRKDSAWGGRMRGTKPGGVGWGESQLPRVGSPFMALLEHGLPCPQHRKLRHKMTSHNPGMFAMITGLLQRGPDPASSHPALGMPDRQGAARPPRHQNQLVLATRRPRRLLAAVDSSRCLPLRGRAQGQVSLTPEPPHRTGRWGYELLSLFYRWETVTQG
ncbi:uncharacterized protein LOC125096857 [Lutra lutra]|uniref:uncharacterized protein LOC125096857 n=1 Tax=Lutra lutra TaxID=9657 RepID=UPI001FD51409|nr:uncharacterized protein LOC125096857 [Lutra lutra]